MMHDYLKNRLLKIPDYAQDDHDPERAIYYAMALRNIIFSPKNLRFLGNAILFILAMYLGLITEKYFWQQLLLNMDLIDIERAQAIIPPLNSPVASPPWYTQIGVASFSLRLLFSFGYFLALKSIFHWFPLRYHQRDVFELIITILACAIPVAILWTLIFQHITETFVVIASMMTGYGFYLSLWSKKDKKIYLLYLLGLAIIGFIYFLLLPTFR